MKKFKNKLSSERIVLKVTRPTISTAKTMFKVIDENRKHLKPWFPWEKQTNKVEDSFKYLLEKEKLFKEGKKIEYGIYIDKEYIGNISIFDINLDNRSAELGYWLSSKHTRKGYMTEAVKIIESEFFDKLDLNRIQIRCDEENIASAGVAKKCHYAYEGKLREYNYNKYFKSFRNYLCFSKLRSEYKKEK